MPFAISNGVRLYFEEAGKGAAIVFVHEFSGDLRSWEAQMRFFSRRYRCIAFNARGYPPSDVPATSSGYSQNIATDDIAHVLRHLEIRQAHIVGCSMGAQATLHFGLRHPRLALSLTAVGAGTGSATGKRSEFLRKTEATARRFEQEGLAAAVKTYRNAPNRIQLQNKDPRGWQEFWERFLEHSAAGHANTLRGLQARRPTIYSLERGLRSLKVPTHLVCGDEDESALDPALFVKRACPAARLTVVANTGHVVNIEEPDLFNRLTADFLALVDSGRWRPRDPRALNTSTMARQR
jgi:pimeloyl-ACP methyl ester carboxylesterase